MTPQLWDFAGIDGLQMARSLFGDAIDRISIFQSIDIHLSDCPCSVLRLCETNFRVVWYDEHPHLPQRLQQAAIGRQVWLRQFNWLGAILLRNPCGAILPDPIDPLLIATPKPPHRLPLPIDCAAPARIDGVSVLIWRHAIDGQPALEVHTATKDLQFIQTKLIGVACSLFE